MTITVRRPTFDLADLPRTWPCLYGGAKGAALLAEDLKRIAPEAE